MVFLVANATVSASSINAPWTMVLICEKGAICSVPLVVTAMPPTATETAIAPATIFTFAAAATLDIIIFPTPEDIPTFAPPPATTATSSGDIAFTPQDIISFSK